ncbi:MAG: radical SAM protein [bacterium]|nr:MAG: radical SAM protein [bacterium]
MNTQALKRIGLFLGATKCAIRSRFINNRPFFVSHLITTRCFARCATCLWRGESTEEQDTSKVINFYHQAKQHGFVSTTFWGGEPLLREDIFEILKACKKFGMVNGLITNGYLLPKYYKSLAQHLDFLLVSIDIPNKEHDQLRGVSGLFDNILIGLYQIRAQNPRLKVFINSVISKLNYPYVEQLIHFAENHSTSVTFESVNQGTVEFPRKEGRMAVDLRLNQDKEKQVFGRIRRLKRAHPVINNSEGYLKLFEKGIVKYRCHAPKISIRVEPDGSVTNCQDRTHPIGNVYQEKLVDILSSPQMKKLQRKAESCSACVDSGVIESSLFWDFNPEVMANSLRLFIK